LLLTPKKYPLVSVVVLNCNGKRLLERCLSAIFDSSFSNFEIIVVDNGSVDGSVKDIVKIFGKDSRLKVISNKFNLGVAEGHNVGIRNSLGEYIAFLDNDTKISQNWLYELTKVLESNSTVGAVQGKIFFMDNESVFDSTGGFIDYYGVSCERGNRKKDVGQYEKVTAIFHSKCSAMMVRRRTLTEVGYFDPLYFTHYDDTDLCWRIWLKGYQVLYTPSAFVLHNVSYTAIELRLDQVYFLAKNCITTLAKNYSAKNLVKYLPGFLALEVTRSILYFAKRDRRSISLVKAILWNLRNWKTIWETRLRVQYGIRRVTDDQLMNHVMVNPYRFPLRLLRRTVNCD
jgi:GT2 family glycosyltransferase